MTPRTLDLRPYDLNWAGRTFIATCSEVFEGEEREDTVTYEETKFTFGYSSHSVIHSEDVNFENIEGLR
jgi:hypothetical protein